jgi:hypothetical protein
MKGKSVYIHNSTDPSIKDIETLSIFDTENLSNGSMDTILCDCLDTVSFKDRIKYLNMLLTKLKINGTLVTKNINLKLFAKNIYNDNIKTDDVNTIIENVKSLIDDDKLYGVIASNPNVRVIENIYSGMNQTITLKRVS